MIILFLQALFILVSQTSDNNTFHRIITRFVGILILLFHRQFIYTDSSFTNWFCLGLTVEYIKPLIRKNVIIIK